MISTVHVRNRLREAGYAYHDTTDRTTVWKKGTHRAYIPKRDFIPEDVARALLSQCGLSREDIDAFLQHSKC